MHRRMFTLNYNVFPVLTYLGLYIIRKPFHVVFECKKKFSKIKIGTYLISGNLYRPTSAEAAQVNIHPQFQPVSGSSIKYDQKAISLCSF